MAEALLARALPRGDAGSLRVGVVESPFWEDIDPEVERACRAALEAGGFTVDAVPIAYADLASAAGGVRASTEMSAAIPAAILPDLDAMTQGMVRYATQIPAVRLLRADRVRARLRREFVSAFEQVDLLAWPTNPAPAPAIASPVIQLPSGPALPDTANLRQAVEANLTGVPGISVPVALHSSGLPIGLQLLAPWGAEATLLDAAARLEDAGCGCLQV
jgi:aspartyl-tRNA(Asn)/glutamyl-tRNA(Gln) amidotransferase subunit A